MMFSHPFSRYGLALVLVKENLTNIEEVTPAILSKYLESGLSHFRMETDNNPETDIFLDFHFIDMQIILAKKIKGNPSKGIFLCPNIISNDLKAANAWSAIIGLIDKLKANPNVLEKRESITMGINPIAGELNNGKKTKTNSSGCFLEVACSAVTNTTDIKPYLAYRKEGGKYVPTAIIPDLELGEMKTFIQFYDLMVNSTINLNQLLKKKVYRKNGKTPSFSKLRPPIYDGNFPYAPHGSAFGVVGLLGAIGRWAKEANKIEEGQKVLECLKHEALYLIQYGSAQSITVNHYVIDLAKENKLSEIVFAIQLTEIYYSDENNRKAKDSKNQLFDLLGSRFLQLFDKPSFKDFLSIRAEYSNTLIELFNYFFMKQMNITKEVVQSVRSLGLWLNRVAYKVAQQEAKNKTDLEEIRKIKSKILVELESSVFGARKPPEILNVIVRAGRLCGSDAPAESDTFKEALLTGEIDIDDAKSMLMAYARTRNKYEPNIKENTERKTLEAEEINTEIDVTH